MLTSRIAAENPRIENQMEYKPSTLSKICKNLQFYLLLCMTLLVISTTAFTPVAQTSDNIIVIYALAYNKECGSEIVKNYEWVMVDKRNEAEATGSLEDKIRSINPSATKITVRSSEYFSKNNRSMLIYRWYVENNKCRYPVTNVAFGKTLAEANDKAEQLKKEWAPRNSVLEIVETKSW